jgi:AbrB family looped-hinge helix DNA binding protein
MEETQIQRRFTVTIPKKIRKQLGLEEGMNLVWETDGKRIIAHPKTFKAFHGMFKGKLKYTDEEKAEVEKVFLEHIAEK